MELKDILFEETLHATVEYTGRVKRYGMWEQVTDLSHARFCALYAIIERSGLEEEYQDWKKSVTVAKDDYR